MGNGVSIHGQPGVSQWWVNYCRQEWRSERVKQLDELLGLQRPPLRRGQSQAHLEDLVKKLTQGPIPVLGEPDDSSDIKSAVAKLNNGTLLHTERRAIERLLAQRYEDALTLAAASTEQSNAGLGGGSEVLQKVLFVLHRNGLETELDRTSTSAEPAEWRVRLHAARRRAFLVVRSMVRLRRELARLSMPISDLGWMLPVAAADRWGELKALAARYRQLEGTLRDTEVAIVQLTQLRDSQARMQPSAPFRGPSPAHRGGVASPQRALRTGAGHRISAPGASGRAISESGAINSRARVRTVLTADPPPPPVAGVRNMGSAHRSAANAVNGITPAGIGPPILVPRSPLYGSKRPATGAVGAADSQMPTSWSMGPNLPSYRPGVVPSSPPGLYSTRGSTSGAANGALGASISVPTPLSNAATAASPPGVLPVGGSGPPSGRRSTPGVGPPGQGTSPSPRSQLRDGLLAKPPGTAGGGWPSLSGSNVQISEERSATSVTALPAVSRAAPQILDLTQQHASTSLPEPLDPLSVPRMHSPTSPGTPTGPQSPSPGSFRSSSLQRRIAGAPTDIPLPAPVLAPATIPAPRGAGSGGLPLSSRMGVEPSPPTGPPPSPAARRPLRPLSPSASSPPLSTPNLNPNLSPISNLTPTPTVGPGGGGGGLRRFTATADGGSAPPVASPVAPPGESSYTPPVLIQEGESVDQALIRFHLMAEDVRAALVDTAREFRVAVNGCNSAWADQRFWLSAHTQEEAALDTWPASDDYVVHRADLVRCLKAGGVAVQFLCAGGEPLVGPNGTRYDWWTCDPWEMAADLAPEAVAEAGRQLEPGAQRLVGVPLGVRQLQQLANSVAEAAGPGALDSLTVILHINERQQETIAADLLQYGVFRRLRRGLFLVVQPSQPLMRYDAASQAFTPAPDQPTYTPGSGFSMLQLLWPNNAMYLNDNWELERLPHSLLTELKNRKTEWFLSRDCTDLSLLSGDGALDLRTLAHVAYMYHSPSHRTTLAVEAVSTYAKHRDLVAHAGSVLLCRKPKVAGMVVGRLDGTVRSDRLGPGQRHQLPVVQLLATELSSEHMRVEMEAAVAARAAATSVGIGRYIFRFETLLSVLTGPTALRPKLLPAAETAAYKWPSPPSTTSGEGPTPSPISFTGPCTGWPSAPFPLPGDLSDQRLAAAASRGLDCMLLRLQLALSDLTMHHAARVAAVKAHRAPVFVRGPQDGARLVELLTASDADLAGAAQRLAAKLPTFARQHKPGQNILVFVQDNGVSVSATTVAAGLLRRERGDRVHLLTVVPCEAARGEGAALMDRLTKAFRTQADITMHVLSMEGRGLLECVSEVVAAQHITMLVVGSTTITTMPTGQPRSGPLGVPATGNRPPGTAAGSMGGGVGPGGGRSGLITPGGPGGGGGGVPMTAGGPPGGLVNEELLLSSVALSILRTFQLPIILVTGNTKNYLKRQAVDAAGKGGRPARPAVGGVGGATLGRLFAMVVAERHSRPMMHHLARTLLEPSLRQDLLTLVQVLPAGFGPGHPAFDPAGIQAIAFKTLMANFESIAAANDFHNPTKVVVSGEWPTALISAARDTGAQLLAVQLAPGTTRSLSPALLQLIRSAPCPVLVYPERVIVPGSEMTPHRKDAATAANGYKKG